MLLTTQNMYEAFLKGIKKEKTTIVPPEGFNDLANQCQEIWRKGKAKELELGQKRIDDLQVLRVVTDGVDTDVNGNILYPVATDTGSDYVFTLPTVVGASINNDQGVTQIYPQYWRMQSVAFKITYQGNACEVNGAVSDWTEPTIKKSDIDIEFNAYTRARDSRLYYDIVSNKIRLITGTSSIGLSAKLEYLRYPRRIFFDETNPADNEANYPAYTVGNGSVKCEMPPDQIQEIVDIMVQTYLEEVEDPRYTTFVQGEMLKSQDK